MRAGFYLFFLGGNLKPLAERLLFLVLSYLPLSLAGYRFSGVNIFSRLCTGNFELYMYFCILISYILYDMKGFERLLWTLSGIAAGHLIGRSIGETEEEKRLNALRGRWIGGAFAFGGTFVFAESKDTVNYIEYDKGERVYDGITKEYRKNIRISEHKSDGKVFDKVVFSPPKTRSAAEDLERYRIRRFKGKYNIQHNS